MSASLSPCTYTVIVSRLRAAGCVFAEDEARLLVSATRNPADLDALVARRVAGQPLEHVLGWAEFCGLRVTVEPGVFVPRLRTELLVRLAVRLVGPGAVALDLCCGSGAVGAALFATLGRLELYAVDIEPAAVRCARRNIAPNGQVYEGDLYDPLPAMLLDRVEVLIANAPYVPSAQIELLPREARIYEPMVALDGGVDGLDVQRRVAAGASRWLAPGGHLLVETSEPQASQTADVLAAGGLTARVVSCAELGATVVIATKPGQGSVGPEARTQPRMPIHNWGHFRRCL